MEAEEWTPLQIQYMRMLVRERRRHANAPEELADWLAADERVTENVPMRNEIGRIRTKVAALNPQQFAELQKLLPLDWP